MIGELNLLVERVDSRLDEPVDVAALARERGQSEYHVRRMFAALAGMPLSEYVRRRRMTLAATALVDGQGVLEVAVAHGYGSTEAFGRAFRAVHGISPADARRSGGPFAAQSRLRFRLTLEGITPMDVRLLDRPAFVLVGHAARVPLIHHGVNPHLAAHIAAIPAEEHARLAALSATEPAGLLQVSDDVDPDYREGSELTALHGVAVPAGSEVPDDLDAIEVPAGWWAVFASRGAYPDALQQTWAATATEWFPSNPWILRPGPSIVAVRERADDFSWAHTELWLPVAGQ